MSLSSSRCGTCGRDIRIDCGCFGGGGVIDPSKAGEVDRAYLIEIMRDLGLAISARYLYFFPHGLFSVEKSANKANKANKDEEI